MASCFAAAAFASASCFGAASFFAWFKRRLFAVPLVPRVLRVRSPLLVTSRGPACGSLCSSSRPSSIDLLPPAQLVEHCVVFEPGELKFSLVRGAWSTAQNIESRGEYGTPRASAARCLGAPACLYHDRGDEASSLAQKAHLSRGESSQVFSTIRKAHCPAELPPRTRGKKTPKAAMGRKPRPR